VFWSAELSLSKMTDFQLSGAWHEVNHYLGEIIFTKKPTKQKKNYLKPDSTEEVFNV
jgi:hypothetical protein